MAAKVSCFVSGILAAVLHLSRLVGIAPLRFVKKKSGWCIYPCNAWNVYGYILGFIFNIANTGALIGELQLEQDVTVHMRTKTRRVVWIIQIGLTMATAAVAVYVAPSQMRNMINYLNQVQKINSDLNINNYWVTSLKKWSVFVFWVTFTLVIDAIDYSVMIFSASQLDAEVWVSAMNFFYYCCYWTMQLREMQFIMVTMHVKHSFSAVNDSLKTLVKELADQKAAKNELFNFEKEFKKYNNYINFTTGSGKSNLGKTEKRPSPHETVRSLALAYTSLCEVLRNVDRSHGLVVVMTLLSLLLHLVCTPYYFIIYLFEASTPENFSTHAINVTLQLIWCIFHTFNLVMIIEPCHATHMEMETTRELVSRMICHTHTIHEPLVVELEQFFMHLVLNEVSYKPLKVITMTRGLLVTILGSITTYLVVIIQL